MTDIRKRVGRKGVTYQVRYPTKGAKTGYAYKSFATMKEARQYVERELPLHRAKRHDTIRTVDQAIARWLDTCSAEGRQGRDPVSLATKADYAYRASMMKMYAWNKDIHELEAPDITAFRSWLLTTYTRDQAKKVLSSFHSVVLEMVAQGVMTTDPAAGITIQESRYKEPVQIPSVEEVQTILRSADALANHKNYWIAKAWERYRSMIYLAADSGMRPQEYLALPVSSLMEHGVQITQALDRSNKIGPTKTRAGRRYIPVDRDTLGMIKSHAKDYEKGRPNQLVFPGDSGGHQRYNNYLRRGWHILMERPE